MAHVLLVDDDKAFVEATRIFLEAKKHKVSVAYSGQEAWDMLQKQRPDILILDCMMEVFTSGFDLAHDISLKFPKLPIIMLTAVHKQMRSDWQFGPEDKEWLPINSFLEKPVAPEVLLREIEQLLGR